MNDRANYLAVIDEMLLHPTGGIVGLVNDLLLLCEKHHLEIDWQPKCYRIRSGNGPWEEISTRPYRPAIFRDMMARLAVLCNEQPPNDVSFYGGQGRFSTQSNAVFHVNFVNTPAEQHLQLIPIRISKTNGSDRTDYSSNLPSADIAKIGA